MKICVLKNPKGKLVDISFVEDDHKFGKDEHGNYHIEDDGSETISTKKQKREK